ncbi:hypothetical protein EDD18DRAFT_1471167 [Armillaria luteobubalina]|uniref:Uncharacterized protein n=1 Tax=Armillaria luteobubalina TaxID=153913 RepID=A0AA39TYX8_9AGAR|nr:hypothetical protein EDD18DRAFT_1471167 [Armillaria luteobubalina]
MPCSLPAPRFARLSTTLRHSKAQYERIADSHRASVRPTHSARKRAARLCLAVNIAGAVACPHKYVSLVPLPLIDDAVHPGSPLVHAASEAIYPQVRELRRQERIPPIVISELGDPRRSPSPELTSCFSAWSMDVPSSSSSGSSLMTPSEGSPVVIRIKRKSVLEEGSDDEAVEKRPRYLRKSWTSRI